jgi:hypothetical protein
VIHAPARARDPGDIPTPARSSSSPLPQDTRSARAAASGRNTCCAPSPGPRSTSTGIRKSSTSRPLPSAMLVRVRKMATDPWRPGAVAPRSRLCGCRRMTVRTPLAEAVS